MSGYLERWLAENGAWADSVSTQLTPLTAATVSVSRPDYDASLRQDRLHPGMGEGEAADEPADAAAEPVAASVKLLAVEGYLQRIEALQGTYATLPYRLSLQGLKQREIAAECGITQGAVSMRLATIREVIEWMTTVDELPAEDLAEIMSAAAAIEDRKGLWSTAVACYLSTTPLNWAAASAAVGRSQTWGCHHAYQLLDELSKRGRRDLAALLAPSSRVVLHRYPDWRARKPRPVGRWRKKKEEEGGEHG